MIFFTIFRTVKQYNSYICICILKKGNNVSTEDDKRVD